MKKFQQLYSDVYKWFANIAIFCYALGIVCHFNDFNMMFKEFEKCYK